MSRRRILLFSDGYAYSGAERYLAELARGLPKDRFQIEAVTAADPEVDEFARDLSRAGAQVFRLERIPTLRTRGPLHRAVGFFLRRRPHLLHFNLTDPRSCNGAMVAAWLAFRRGFVVTEHLPTSPFDSSPLPFRHRLARRHTACTIVNSDHYRSAVLTRPGFQGRVEVIPNGVPDPGPPTTSRRLAARARLGFDGLEGPLVGWAGRAEPQKDLDLLIEGARRLLPARPEARVLVLGDGPDLEPAKAKVADLGLGGAVKFYGHREDGRELLYGLDFLVNTSRYEGMPFSILEAMASGLAVVGPRIPGVVELVGHLASGWLYIQGDGDDLGQKLIDATGDIERAHQLGLVGRERMLTLFSLESMCQKTAEIYAELLARRGA